MERVKRNIPDMIVTEIQDPQGCQGLERGVGQFVDVEGVGHLEVEEGLPDLPERILLDPCDLVAGQIQPRHTRHVVEGVAPDDFDVGVNQMELLHPRGKVLELANEKVVLGHVITVLTNERRVLPG